jgi:hypothetical protein
VPVPRWQLGALADTGEPVLSEPLITGRTSKQAPRARYVQESTTPLSWPSSYQGCC